MNKVQTVKRVIHVLDTPVQVGVALFASMTLNSGVFVSDAEFFCMRGAASAFAITVFMR